MNFPEAVKPIFPNIRSKSWSETVSYLMLLIDFRIRFCKTTFYFKNSKKIFKLYLATKLLFDYVSDLIYLSISPTYEIVVASNFIASFMKVEAEKLV